MNHYIVIICQLYNIIYQQIFKKIILKYCLFDQRTLRPLIELMCILSFRGLFIVVLAESSLSVEHLTL